MCIAIGEREILGEVDQYGIDAVLICTLMLQAKVAAAEEDDGEGGGGNGWHEEYLLAKAVSIRTRKVSEHQSDSWL